MPEYRSFLAREQRPPTAAEARRDQELEASGLADVYIPVEQAPPGFWECILQATHRTLLPEQAFDGSWGQRWWDELRWQEGWPPLPPRALPETYAALLRDGSVSFVPGKVNTYVRLSAIEHLYDVRQPSEDFNDLVNEAAARFRVGIRLEGARFVDVTSTLIHREVVRPALQLLAEPEYDSVDELYRKAFDRLLAGDPAGAITAAASAVEEMLRKGECTGASLKELTQAARNRAWITPGVQQSIVKLDAYREDSDAHRVGTDEPELARLVLHLAASLLLYLGRTRKKLS